MRIVLEIAVQHDYPIAARDTHAGSQSRNLAVIPVEFDNSKAGSLADHGLQPGKSVIGRSIVNHDDLRAEIKSGKHQG